MARHRSARKFSIALLVGGLTLGAAAVAPTAADAGVPFPGSPTKPVLDGDMIVGETEMATTCGGLPCETYIGISQQVNGKWKTLKWERITNRAGLQDIEVDAPEGKFKYRTVVVDYVTMSTPGACGPKTVKIGKDTYTRYLCLGNSTIYQKVWGSPTVWLDYDEVV